MKKIPLSKKGSKNKGKYFALIDDADFEKVSAHNWSVVIAGNDRCYAVTTTIKKHKIRIMGMHNLIMGTQSLKTPIDHLNRNGLDNRNKNLIVSTVSANNRNRLGYGKSGCKGVYKHISHGILKWMVSVVRNGKSKTLKKFPFTESGKKAATKFYKSWVKANRNVPTLV